MFVILTYFGSAQEIDALYMKRGMKVIEASDANDVLTVVTDGNPVTLKSSKSNSLVTIDSMTAGFKYHFFKAGTKIKLTEPPLPAVRPGEIRADGEYDDLQGNTKWISNYLLRIDASPVDPSKGVGKFIYKLAYQSRGDAKITLEGKQIGTAERSFSFETHYLTTPDFEQLVLAVKSSRAKTEAASDDKRNFEETIRFPGAKGYTNALPPGVDVIAWSVHGGEHHGVDLFFPLYKGKDGKYRGHTISFRGPLLDDLIQFLEWQRRNPTDYGVLRDDADRARVTDSWHYPWRAEVPEQNPPLERVKNLAAEGNSLAQYELALRFTTGAGLPKNADQAAKWARKSADQGYPAAQTMLGLYYRDTAKDLKQAERWLQMASKQQHGAAQFALGEIELRKGNKLRAVEWLSQAHEHGEADRSAALMKSVLAAMTPEEIAQMKAAAKKEYEQSGGLMVSGIKKGETVSLRDGPDIRNKVIATLPYGTRNIRAVDSKLVGGTRWMKIETGNITGWLKESFVAIAHEQKPDGTLQPLPPHSKSFWWLW